jgi:hypothetical protein
MKSSYAFPNAKDVRRIQEKSMAILPNDSQTKFVYHYVRSTPPAGWTVAK